MTSSNHLICERRSYSKEYTSHEHDFGQFLFPLQGSLDIETKWQEINLNSDYCFYLPPKCHHNYRSKDRNEFLILDIPAQYLPEDTNSTYKKLDQQWTAIRYLLLEEATNSNSSASLTNLAMYITSKLESSVAPSIKYIHQHFKQSISIETLAKIEHYHSVYYSTWFKKQTGKSPTTYIAELRLNEARQLLLSTSWSISSIGEEIGFENTSSFTRWFVHWEGISPQTYRNLNNR